MSPKEVSKAKSNNALAVVSEAPSGNVNVLEVVCELERSLLADKELHPSFCRS